MSCLRRWIALTLACLWIPAASWGDSARLLLTDEDAFLARLALGNHVEKEVNYATYELDEGRVGMLVLARLCQLARDGKIARLLVDGWNPRISSPMLAHLALDCGVQVRVYHPLDRPLQEVTRRPFDWKTQRMHLKLFLSDGTEAIAGSRNTLDRYFTFKGQPPRNRPAAGQPRSSDIDFYVKGASVADANAFFVRLFNSPEALPPAGLGKVTPRARARAGVRLARYAQLFQKWYADPEKLALAEATLRDAVPVRGARFLHNDFSSRGNKPGADKAVIEVLEKAKPGCEILLETPYLVLPAKVREALRTAVGRGCAIHILTNDENEGDDWPTSVAYKNERSQVIDLGRTRAGRKLWIWEKQRLSAEHDPEGKLARPTTLHGKAATNGTLLAVGSANLDPRSYDGLNLEDMWLFDSPELSAELARRRLYPLVHSRHVKEAARNTPSFYIACRNGFLGYATALLRSEL